MIEAKRPIEYVKVLAIFYIILAVGVAGISVMIFVQGIYISRFRTRIVSFPALALLCYDADGTTYVR